MGKKRVKRVKRKGYRGKVREKGGSGSGPRYFIGIDPGQSGALVSLDSVNGEFSYAVMPVVQNGKTMDVSFEDFEFLLADHSSKDSHIFLERAAPFHMGTTSAFNYGRGFAAIEIAIQRSEIPVTYVEAGKWTKVIHQGISQDLKPKAKSLIALKRLFPKLAKLIPAAKTGKLHEGVVDALLIAAFGMNQKKT